MPGRPLALDTTDAGAPDAEPSARVVAEGLAMSLPDALLLRRDPRGVATPFVAHRRAFPIETPLGPLRDWLAFGAARPPSSSANRLRVPRAILPSWARRAAPIPRDAALILPGIAAWTPAVSGLLGRRPDICAIAVLDLPLARDWPEYATASAAAALPGALAALSAGASAIVVPDEATARRFREGLGSRSSDAPRLLVEPRPSALAGSATPVADPALAAACYMVACGPIESRANTTLLLQIWRDLAARGRTVPRLVLAGRRGTQIEDIRPLLEWNATLQAHIVEAPDLSPSGLRTLLAHARALLAPDFAGIDAPLLRDASACGVPIIAATPPDAADPAWTSLSPIDGCGWRAAVLTAAARQPLPFAAPPSTLPDWPGYAARVAALGRRE